MKNDPRRWPHTLLCILSENFSQPHINGFNFVARTHNTGWLVSGEIPRVRLPYHHSLLFGKSFSRPPPLGPLEHNTNTRRKVHVFSCVWELKTTGFFFFFLRGEVHASPVKVENHREGKLHASIHRAYNNTARVQEKGCGHISVLLRTNNSSKTTTGNDNPACVRQQFYNATIRFEPATWLTQSCTYPNK